jgi:hypothetical protein
MVSENSISASAEEEKTAETDEEFSDWMI